MDGRPPAGSDGARISNLTPQKLDSVTRTFTASILALSLVGSVVYLAISKHGAVSAAAVEAVKAAALIVVGFYFGGHVAQNTATVEEARQIAATAAAEASAARSEASASRSADRTQS